MKETPQKNSFSSKIIDHNVNNTLNNKSSINSNENKNNKNDRYFKLPYIGSFSSYTETKLKIIIEK